MSDDQIEQLTSSLLAELKAHISSKAYEHAERFLQFSEYRLALEYIAYDAVALTIPWNRALFNQIARALDTTDSQLMEQARRERIHDGLNA